MDVMQGVPPPEDGRATLTNWRQAPFSRWAFHHVREIVPTANIANEPAAVRELPSGEADLFGARLEEAVTGMANDALVILHRGHLVHESYRNGMTAEDPHILFSVSKSLLGLVAGVLAGRGQLDVAAPVTEYLPELRDTAYAGATIRQALDMRVGVRFDEDYTATAGPIIEYRKAANWNPLAPGETTTDLRGFQSLLTDTDGAHGGRFHYVSPVTDMLGWALERASGVRYADLLSECLLRPLGAARPGYITVDRIGGARAAGGICLTARDLARVGLLMLRGGACGERQVVPEAWVADIWQGGDRQAWRNGDFADRYPGVEMSYRSKWYLVHGDKPLLRAIGIHGQYLFADPVRDLVVAWFSSEDAPTDPVWAGHVATCVNRIRESFD